MSEINEIEFFMNEMRKEVNEVLKWSFVLQSFKKNPAYANEAVNEDKKKNGVRAYFLGNEMYAKNQQLVHMSKTSMLYRALRHRGVVLAEKTKLESEREILAFCNELKAM